MATVDEEEAIAAQALAKVGRNAESLWLDVPCIMCTSHVYSYSSHGTGTGNIPTNWHYAAYSHYRSSPFVPSNFTGNIAGNWHYSTGCQQLDTI